MKQIPLTQGKFALVDDEDFENLLVGCKWFAHRRKVGNKEKWYVLRHIKGSGKFGIAEYMHRVIMQPPKDMVIDHINGDGLDNRRENLRVCTFRENMRNNHRAIAPKSGYRGVYWSIPAKKWEVKITPMGQKGKKIYHHGGYFLDPLEAAKSYNMLAQKVYGEFAVLNVL